MEWNSIWLTLFGTTHFFGLNMGFWVSLLLVGLIVIIMNLVFWNMKPYNKNNE